MLAVENALEVVVLFFMIKVFIFTKVITMEEPSFIVCKRVDVVQQDCMDVVITFEIGKKVAIIVEVIDDEKH